MWYLRTTLVLFLYKSEPLRKSPWRKQAKRQGIFLFFLPFSLHTLSTKSVGSLLLSFLLSESPPSHSSFLYLPPPHTSRGLFSSMTDFKWLVGLHLSNTTAVPLMYTLGEPWLWRPFVKGLMKVLPIFQNWALEKNMFVCLVLSHLHLSKDDRTATWATIIYPLMEGNPHWNLWWYNKNIGAVLSIFPILSIVSRYSNWKYYFSSNFILPGLLASRCSNCARQRGAMTQGAPN